VTQVAKVLRAFAKAATNKLPVVKGGYLSGQTLVAAQVESLADIPPREVLLGRMVGTIAAPMTRLVGAMNQKICSLLYVLKAVADKKAAGN
jgi:large subunit ribosomal protein L10